VSGDRLAWLQWDHPNMPWDGTELAVATIRRGADGAPEGLDGTCVVAGGPAESVVQPGFLADGSLAFCTDRTGWWGPWRLPADGGAAVPMLHSGVDGEIGGPLWVGGLRWWTELGPGYLLVTVRADGVDRLALITPDGVLDELDTPFTEIGQLAAVGDGTSAAVVAAGAIEEPAPYLLEVLAEGGPEPIVVLERLREPRDDGVDPAWFSRPTHVSFRSAEGRTAHALHYPPHHPEVAGPAGEHPPLIVVIHGGPTSAARVRLDLAKQFWTSRGFAVLDVNHGGSTGYGRPFRDLLRGRWGEVDVADAVAAARHLADIGEADPHRMAIRGGSAGGFTTLAALCFHDAFAAGASHYGVADLAALAAETHKLESRYLDSLVGPWPEARETYEARSPIHHTNGLSVPLLVLQGSEDEVVPPDQAEMIVAALAAKGIPHAYLLFEGEQHGFRRADTIVRALEAELWFYGRVFGFTPADRLEPVPGAVGL
jgi:dipeptidyl aminopeptidase/acylaminoacyl peptidase